MREILFRGKGTIDGEWKYGYYAGEVCKTPFSPTTKQDNIIQLGSNLWCEVVPDTVGQFTGLTDKNGTKIFEGDIVRYGDSIHKVVFEQRNGTAYFGLVYSPIETLPFGHYQDLRQFAVIGNIYDNPELIGGAEDENS